MKPTPNAVTRQRTYWLAGLVLLLSLPSLGQAQPGLVGYHPGPLPKVGPAPLLYVRIIGPSSLHATIYTGGVTGRTLQAPATVGLRPGYRYRLELTGFPDHPGVALYPTLEVIGTVQVSPKLKASDHPAPLYIHPEDIRRVLGGAMITKVVYLEDPETAIAMPSQPDHPLELNALGGRDPLAEARERGRPVLIVRLGQRQATPQELACQAIAGTVLLPGEKFLSTPACPPPLAWACFPVHDPRVGARPNCQECLHDGGDFRHDATVDGANRLRGLDPGDTVAEYTDSHGRRHLSPSNRVCICVPRFVIVRSELGPSGYEIVHAVGSQQSVQKEIQLRNRLAMKENQEYKQAEAVLGRQRLTSTVSAQYLDRVIHVTPLEGYEVELGPADFLGTKELYRLTGEQLVRLQEQIKLAQILSQPYGLQGNEVIQAGPAAVARVEGLDRVVTVQGTRDLTVCEGEPCAPDKPLVLFKWADRQSAQVGDVVTFYLKFSNHGGKPMTDVAISDSLTGRLEYVPDSAESSRDAVFTMQENEAGSLILRWEISGKLLPGQHGVVRFKARIR